MGLCSRAELELAPSPKGRKSRFFVIGTFAERAGFCHFCWRNGPGQLVQGPGQLVHRPFFRGNASARQGEPMPDGGTTRPLPRGQLVHCPAGKLVQKPENSSKRPEKAGKLVRHRFFRKTPIFRCGEARPTLQRTGKLVQRPENSSNALKKRKKAGKKRKKSRKTRPDPRPAPERDSAPSPPSSSSAPENSSKVCR